MTVETAPACFNCGTTDGVKPYSFDMDLPIIPACRDCLMALTLGDDETLKALQPRKVRERRT